MVWVDEQQACVQCVLVNHQCADVTMTQPAMRVNTTAAIAPLYAQSTLAQQAIKLAPVLLH